MRADYTRKCGTKMITSMSFLKASMKYGRMRLEFMDTLIRRCNIIRDCNNHDSGPLSVGS